MALWWVYLSDLANTIESDLETCISEVRHFEVWEAGATKETDFIGDVYLDLYPRGLSQIFLLMSNLR